MSSDISGKNCACGHGRQADGAVSRCCKGKKPITGIPYLCSLQCLRVHLHFLSGLDGEAEVFAGTQRESAPEDRFEAFFVLSGTLRVCLTDGDCSEHYRVAAGRCSVCFFPGGCRPAECRAEDRAAILRIGFTSPEMLGEGRLRREMDEAACKRRPARVEVPMNSQMDRVVARAGEVLERDTNSASLALSCALELVWHVVSSRECASLSVVERERSAVDAARRILESRLDDPPSLEELAARVGMSVSKFKQVFNRTCGKPPYAFLREVRLERAMSLLRDDGVRVTEAAMEVGYNNLSYFAKAFSEHFGVKPSQVRGEG